MKQEQTWNDVKKIWGNSAKGAKINFKVSELLNELKGKMSQFEKNSIKSDINKIKLAWAKDKKKVSQFEKDSVKKDLNILTSFLKKIVTKFKPKNE
ncbi:hypothetical protein OO009_11175 [Flavobacteriaceae bacterium KMM 6897]|nr:hypothetical protein [Flavobacteriaceae bacterium KMM 6897]